MQHYYHYKVSLWTASECFPVEYEQLVKDSLSALRPGIRLCQDLEEATKAVDALNAQLLNKAILVSSYVTK